MAEESKFSMQLEHVLTSELDLQDQLGSGYLEGYAIRGVLLSRTSFEDKKLKMVAFNSTSVENLSFERMEAENVQYSGARMRGAYFSGAQLNTVNMLNCEAFQAHFTEAVLDGCSIFDTKMPSSSFQKAKLIKTQFQDTELYGASF